MKKANEAKSYFLCSGLDETTFEVTEFTGVDMISGPYQFEITLRSVNDDIDPEGVIGKQGTLFIHRDEEFYPYSGMISEFKFIEQNKDYCTYIVRLVPRLWALQLNIQSRIFQKMTVPKIIQKVISDAGIGDVTMDVGSYPEHEFIVQYQESDLDFISRLMESAGIFYFFKENPLLEEELSPGCTSESLVITDKPSSFLEINGETTLLYKARSGLNERIEEEAKESMHDIRFETRVIPREVVTRNYNYRTPENFPAGKSPVKGGHKGALYHFGGAAKNVSEANAEAKVESNRMASGRIQMSGECNCVGLRAGHRFTLDGDVKDRLKKSLWNGQAHPGIP